MRETAEEVFVVCHDVLHGDPLNQTTERVQDRHANLEVCKNKISTLNKIGRLREC